jgi:hypothetical protein
MVSPSYASPHSYLLNILLVYTGEEYIEVVDDINEASNDFDKFINSLPLSKIFKKVFASDISKSMTEEAAARAKELKLNHYRRTKIYPNLLRILLTNANIYIHHVLKKLNNY